MLKILNKIQVALYDLFYNVTGVVLAFILAIVLAGIVSRYIFNSPFIWTEEVCTILMVYLAYFSAIMATIAQEHVVADFFKGLLPKRFNKLLTFVIRLFEIFFFVFVAYSCILYIPRYKTYRTPTLLIPRFVFYIPVLTGTIAMVYAICVHVINDLIPGYNYFQQRKEDREQAFKRQEEEEEKELIDKMDSFMDEVEKSEKGGQS